MLSGQTAASGSSSTSRERPQRVIEEEEEEEPEFRDIHALSPPRAPQSYRRSRAGSRDSWGSRHTSIRSVGSDTAPSEPFPSMSREFSAMVAAAASANAASAEASRANGEEEMGRIGEEAEVEETNPLAIVPDSNPIPSPRWGTATATTTPRLSAAGGEVAAAAGGAGHGQGDGVSVGQVKKEEVECKIAAWQIAEVAKVNNRFKREEVVINGWEGDQVEKASAWLNKYEDQTSIDIAKVVSSGVAGSVLKATAHDDALADDRHAFEVLRLRRLRVPQPGKVPDPAPPPRRRRRPALPPRARAPRRRRCARHGHRGVRLLLLPAARRAGPTRLRQEAQGRTGRGEGSAQSGLGANSPVASMPLRPRAPWARSTRAREW